MPKKAYLEITNACNLSCSFCHGTNRKIRYMSVDEFRYAAGQLRTFAEYLYFHVLGEPLVHPALAEFLAIAGELGFKVVLTTNGTLLREKSPVLLAADALHKVSISLHAYEANALCQALENYLSDCFAFSENAAKQGIISVMRLWNRGGEESLNQRILEQMHAYFDTDGADWDVIYSGYKIRDKVYLEWGERFDWPDIAAKYRRDDHSCYGLRDQVGVLCDGTVVPCCLDADGSAALGNIFETPLNEILVSPRACALRKSFQIRKITEPLCQRCGYAAERW